MALFRTVSTGFWSDAKIDPLTAAQKLVFLYLLTNPLTTLCGCYEVSSVRVARELGYSVGEVEEAFTALCEAGVIERSAETGEVLIVHWDRYNWTSSKKLDKALIKSISTVKCGKLRAALIEKFNNSRSIPYPYPIDTVSIPYRYPTDTVTSIASIQVPNNSADTSNRRGIVENALTQEPDAWLDNYRGA